jgi:hypothetical protein
MSLRTPTSPERALEFHARALAGARDSVHENDPRPGWWKMRIVKKGPWVPVKIWLEQDIDEGGELLGPEIVRCLVDGSSWDPRDAWLYCCNVPIAEHEFQYLTALRAWQRINEPELWDPYKPVDISQTPIEG